MEVVAPGQEICDERRESEIHELPRCSGDVAWVTTEITKVYKVHNPEKIDDILKQMKTKYVGQEMRMYHKACKKYGVTPSNFTITRADTKAKKVVPVPEYESWWNDELEAQFEKFSVDDGQWDNS